MLHTMSHVEYLLLLICLLGAFALGEGVTDQEFQEVVAVVKQLKAENEELRQQMAVLMSDRLFTEDGPNGKPGDRIVQNTTIEERVSLLELQVVDLDEDVDFLFDEQVIQDERLQNLEQSDVLINQILFQVDEDIEDLQDTTLALDFRVSVLEENGGGGGGNSSITELEERVETLEGTAADHETRLSGAEEDIEATIAFNAVLTSYVIIAAGDSVVFNEVLVNEGDGYDNTSGVFTVPSGGDGFYYLSTYLLVDNAEYAYLNVQVNTVTVCTAVGDENSTGDNDYSQGSCSAVVNLTAGDQVQVRYQEGTNNTPVEDNTFYYWTGFVGFRI